ncbi:PIG-L family deacetylase [Pelagibacteraceae bacterium]|nr:PIG-L family deacetylase [Pelagibacteraceae bacterium]
MNKENMLIIAAHPDDEVLGCGGTIAKYSSKKNIYLCILSDGESSRDISNKKNLAKKIENRKKMALKSSAILGIKKVFFGDFPDNKFDSVDLLSIVKFIEKIIIKVKPSTVFTHYENDLNIDHCLTFKASITACRPQYKNNINIFSYFVPSSTDWNLKSDIFNPNWFEEISKFSSTKKKALNCYSSELRKSPHPRSLKYIESLDLINGEKIGVKKAEAYLLLRYVK